LNSKRKTPLAGRAMAEVIEQQPSYSAASKSPGHLEPLINKLSALRLLSPIKILPFGLITLSLLLWFLALSRVDLSNLTDLGLISALPLEAFIALGIITISFSLVITRPNLDNRIAFLHLVVVVFMLYGITAIIEEVPRFGPSWRHAGVIDYIMRHGSVNPRIDAYFNWPGMFIMGALITQIAGLDSAVFMLSWAPMFFQLLYMGPLWIIYSSLNKSNRLAWLALWIYYITNWVGQDYFSPQAMNFFYFLVILAIFIHWFRNTNPGENWLTGNRFIQKIPFLSKFLGRVISGEVHYSESASTAQKAVLLVMVVVIYFVSITSHQLTQFAILISLILLLLFQRITPRLVPVILLILSSMWIVYMASAYMSGRLAEMLQVFGNLDTALDANLVNRMSGSPGHVIVTRIRLVVTLGIWLAAFAGFIRSWLRGRVELTAALLVAAPFPLLAMQSYGGEMLMRIFLFSLPLGAYLSAALIFPLKIDPPSWRYTAIIGVISVGLISVFWLTRYGNERMEYFSPQEVEAVEYAYTHMEEGSLLATVTTNLAYKSKNYEVYRYTKLEDQIVYKDLVAILNTVYNPRYKASYFLLTRSQRAYIEMFYGHNAVDWEHIIAVLLAAPDSSVVYQNEDAILLEFIPVQEPQ